MNYKQLHLCIHAIHVNNLNHLFKYYWLVNGSMAVSHGKVLCCESRKQAIIVLNKVECRERNYIAYYLHLFETDAQRECAPSECQRTKRNTVAVLHFCCAWFTEDWQRRPLPNEMNLIAASDLSTSSASRHWWTGRTTHSPAAEATHSSPGGRWGSGWASCWTPSIHSIVGSVSITFRVVVGVYHGLYEHGDKVDDAPEEICDGGQPPYGPMLSVQHLTPRYVRHDGLGCRHQCRLAPDF